MTLLISVDINKVTLIEALGDMHVWYQVIAPHHVMSYPTASYIGGRMETHSSCTALLNRAVIRNAGVAKSNYTHRTPTITYPPGGEGGKAGLHYLIRGRAEANLWPLGSPWGSGLMVVGRKR